MGKFIYILFIIGWVIYNVYKAINKNNTKTTKPSNTPGESKEDQLKDIIERALGGRTITKSEPEVIDTPTTSNTIPVIAKPEKKIRKYDYELLETPYVSEENKKDNTAITGLIMPQVTEEQETQGIKDFDLAKAVLYSEILKRPAWYN